MVRWPGDAADPRWSSWFLLEHELQEYTLYCRSDHPPDGRWLSIAETFEFLPHEG